MKSKRQDAILEIIEKYEIETQEDLIDKLGEAGFAVTQATVSRDIREMKLVKVTGEHGNYKYVVPGAGGDDGQHVYNAAFISSIKSVDCAMNIVVIKTYPGMANAVAATLDTMTSLGIVGCVAGDDTIFAATHSIENAKDATNRIRSIADSAKKR